MQRPGEARALRGHPSPRVGSARLITARRPLPGAVWERGGDGSLSATVPKTRHHDSIAEETVVLRDVPVKTIETLRVPRGHWPSAGRRIRVGPQRWARLKRTNGGVSEDTAG